MRIHKTPQEKRTTYPYRFCDGTTSEIRPGENGITEVHIKMLYAEDDHEVYLNCKNGHPPLTESEKAAKAEWEKEHPGEKYPTGWNLSLDYLSSDDDKPDKTRILGELYYDQDEVSPEVERLREIVAGMTERQRQVYQLHFIEGYSLTDTAAILGMSVPTVYNHKKRVLEIIKENF